MLKTFLRFLFLIIGFFCFSQINPTIDDVPDRSYGVRESISESERIIDFHSDIEVGLNSELTVTETIKVYANGNNVKRGIFRSLPTIRNLNTGREDVSYKILSITKNGNPEPYHAKTEDKIFMIYIGSKDVTLDSGIYTYEIKYKTQDQIGRFSGYDELYWNVNGTDWDFPVEKISANIHLPKGADILQNSCYTGIEGSKEKKCNVNQISSTEIRFTANDLDSRENLTVAVGFNAGVLKAPSGFIKFLKKNWEGLILLTSFLSLVGYFFQKWRLFGNKKSEKPIIIPQFNAPNDFSPAMIGYLDKEKFSVTQTTANIIQLSIKKIVKIKEDKDHQQETPAYKIYDLTLLGDDHQDLQEDQQELVKNIFKTKKTIHVDGTFNSDLSKGVEKLEKYVTTKGDPYLKNEKNTAFVSFGIKVILSIFMIALLFLSIKTGDYTKLLTGGIMIFFDSILLALIIFLWDKTKVVAILVAVFAFMFFLPIFAFAFNSSLYSGFESHIYKFLIFSVIALLIFRHYIKKPSEERLKIKSEIEGFKKYLSVAEEKYIQYLNPPEMTTDLYEKMLPYAIVFGVEGIWGKRFRDAIDQSSVPLDIYEDLDTLANNPSFSRSLVSSSIAPKSTYSSSGSSSRSSRSSSSYSGGSSSSGSRGGGSSGGGGGGGGGGGW